MRSAIAPAISPTVITAKSPWNIAKSEIGTPPSSEVTSTSMSRKAKYCVGSPTSPPPRSSPKAIEKPTTTQVTLTTARAPKTIMIMLSTLLERTIPP